MELDPRANRTGDTWHVMLSALPSLEGLCYGWRVEGDTAWETGNRFQPGGWAGGTGRKGAGWGGVDEGEGRCGSERESCAQWWFVARLNC